MLLAIDIGNTSIAFGVFKGEKLYGTWHASSGIHRLPDEYAVLMTNLFSFKGIKPSDIKRAILCSTVPPLVSIFEEVCERYFGIKTLVVGAGTKTGVRICMDNPREVGTDRVVNAAAAHHLYGGPLIVIDLGTATTFDVVSAEGDYLGGAIAPGIGIASEALWVRTAKLPRVELVRPKQAIGKNSVTAIQSGTVFGYIGLMEGIVARMRRELGVEARVIATGGYANSIGRETPVIQEINPDLTLIGLRLIHELNGGPSGGEGHD
jgi:type III pantothenate kinase